MNTINFDVSVVITAFRIGPVLSDTIHSVLSQLDVSLGNIVVVVDGCSYQTTTRSTLERFSRGYDNLVQFIWLQNGGVSRARNTGARWLLENRPGTEGIYYIDGDDLLNPQAISNSIRTLRESQLDEPTLNIGWTYCNQNQFGDDTPSVEYPRKAIPIRWLSNNLSQPSCLIDRKMFDSGVFWDEDMRKGIEDWEYWLTAIECGFIGTHIRDTYLRYRQLTGNRSSLNRANDAVTKNYMREKHKGLYTADFFLENEHTLFPRWAFSHSNASLNFDVGTDTSLPMITRNQDYVRRALSYRFTIGQLNSTILEPYFPDMIAFVDQRDEDILNRLKILPSTLREIETIVEKHGSCTLSISQSDLSSDNKSLGNDNISISKHLETSKKLSEHTFSSYFLSIKKLFELLKLNKQNISDVQVMTICSHWSLKHLNLKVTGIDIPMLSDPLPGKSAGTHLSNMVVELHRIYRLPAALSLLQRDRHNLCGSNLATHEDLGTDILGVWPILPKLKRGKHQIGILLAESSVELMPAILKDIECISGQPKQFEINVLILGNECTLTTLISNPLISTIGLIEQALDMQVNSTQNGYLGVPAYELLNESTQRNIIGHMANMDIVVDVCGPSAAGIMMNLKSRHIHTSTLISCVDALSNCINISNAANTSNQPRIDPLAIQAYIGAYNSLIVPRENDADKLVSYGVAPTLMVETAADVIACVIENDNCNSKNSRATAIRQNENPPLNKRQIVV